MKLGKKRKKRNIIFLICGMLFIALLVYNFLNKETYVSIKAECGELMGNVFNRIKTEEDCKVQCRNECIARDLDLSRTKLIKETAQCNSCECHCK